MDKEIELSTPLVIGNEEISVLKMRPPIAKDLIDIGYPFLVMQGDEGTFIKILPAVVAKYASKLAGVPPSAIAKIENLDDFRAIQEAVMDFLGGGV